jgi:hypothetical protein
MPNHNLQKAQFLPTLHRPSKISNEPKAVKLRLSPAANHLEQQQPD